jgi:hypothetical protein
MVAQPHVKFAQPATRWIHLADNLHVDIDTLLGEAIVGFGLPGSGKTNACALLAEQFGQYFIPQAIFDKEGDYTSLADVLPRGIVATATNYPSGYDILEYGLQVVYDLSTWESPEDAARLMIRVVGELMVSAEGRPPSARVPALVLLDEASYWLPEKRSQHLEEETFKQLRHIFTELASRGRKRGLAPALFAQRISELAKAVLTPGIYILMRQTLDTDLKRYMEYVTSTLPAKQIKSRIASFGPGRAIVKLPGGKQHMVTFYERQSEHVSHTPKSQAALEHYASLPFNPDMQFGAAPKPVPFEGVQAEIMKHIDRVGPLTFNTLFNSYMKRHRRDLVQETLQTMVEQGILRAVKTSHSVKYHHIGIA